MGGMAKISKAAPAQAAAAAEVRKYEGRIEMSTLTETQDEQLLRLAKERAISAKGNMPSTNAAEQALQQVRAQDVSPEKRLSMYEAQVIQLMTTGKSGPELEAAKE